MERYQRMAHLGRGSFATVSLVHKTGDATALRVVKEVDLRADAKQRSEALREVEVLKSLCHPNVIAYDDAFLADSRLCIIMEYADGGDLNAAIARHAKQHRRYHEREAMAVFVQLAIALQYIHERRILHRDLKSQNVFLTSAGVAKLGDFGIAKVLEESETFADTRIGTPHYLPPEMCSNKPYEFSADVWCLGVVLYELLALEVPFSAPSMASLVLKICTTEPRPVPSVYSNELRALLARMLAKGPRERPLSAEIVAMPHVRRSIAAVLAHAVGRDRTLSAGSEGGEASRASTASTALRPCGIGGASAASEPELAQPAPRHASAEPEPELLAQDCSGSGSASASGEVVRLGVSRGSPSPGALLLDELELAAAESMGPSPPGAEAGQVALMQASLRLALESSATCEDLLRELEQEFERNDHAVA